ncbi:MAG: alpha/beta hydrolase [Lachnospiraceae bacterium]|nr:alpha/beta hydrolase [Lachnospiraceae bacterium]
MICEVIKIALPESEHQAELYTYFLDNSPEMHPKKKRPVVLICPGGGYEMTSDREAEPVAVRFLAMGFHAAVLRYSVAPARFPEAILQLASAVTYLRAHAEQYHLDADKIVVQGSSAGGHLAASLGVFWNRPDIVKMLNVSPEMIRPNGLMLCYPVITAGEKAHQGSFRMLLGEDAKDDKKRSEMSLELHVTKDTPKTFLWHTITDETVPVENSLLFFDALHKNQISAELHIYPVGGHGLSLANEETSAENGYGIQPECQSWIELAGIWMRNL